MGLTMSQRRAVTKTIATRYKRADKAAKGVVLDELCATTGWHRNHARKALAAALKPKIVKPARRARTPKYDANTMVALRFCWAVLGAPTGKRLAPMMGELVPTLAPVPGTEGHRRDRRRAGGDVGGDHGPPTGPGPREADCSGAARTPSPAAC